MPFSVAARVCVFGFAISAVAEDAYSDTRYAMWPQARSAVIQDTVYIEGGSPSICTWYEGKCHDINDPVLEDGTLFSLNLSTPFDVTLDSTNLTALFRHLPEGTGIPVYQDGTLFANELEFYTYGGAPGSQSDSTFDSLVNYQAKPAGSPAPRWEASARVRNLLPSDVSNYVSNGAGVNIPSENLGFYFSGLTSESGGFFTSLETNSYTSDTGMSTVSDTMVKIDLSQYGNASWENITIDARITPRAESGLAWIPVGAQGLLLVIGGLVHPGDVYLVEPSSADNTQSASFMTQIPVYDIASKEWWLQTTQGHAQPGPLGQFCTVVASAKGGSSHEIFIYGGYSGSIKPLPNDEVWILSVPSFTWVKATDGVPQHARSAHFCVQPYPNTMLTIGGRQDSSDDSDADGTIPTGKIIDVYDLNKLQWTGKYLPEVSSDYKVNSTVTTAINSVSALPPNMDTTLSTIFKTPYQRTIPSYYPYRSTSTKISSTPTWRWPVIGAVIGGVTALTLGGALWWYCRPSKRRNRKSLSSEATSGHTRVFGWLQGTNTGLNARKALSETTTTDVAGDMSPPTQPFEAFGDYFYRPQPSRTPRDTIAEVSANDHHLSMEANAVTSPRSPRSPHSGSELDGAEIQEMPGMIERPNALGLMSAQSIRDHPMYPNSVLERRRCGSDTSMSPPPLPASSPTSHPHPPSLYALTHRAGPVDEISDIYHQDTSPVLAAVQLASSPSQTSATRKPISSPIRQTSPDLEASPLMRQVRNSVPISPDAMRPGHQRNSSSLSSGMSQLPSPGVAEEQRRSRYVEELPRPSVREEDETVMPGIDNTPPRSAYHENTYRYGRTL